MGASPDASVTLWDTGTVDDCGVALAFALRGVDTTTPLDVAINTTSSLNPGAVTPASANCAVVVMSSTDTLAETVGTISSYTKPSSGEIVASDVGSLTAAGCYRLLSGGAGASQDPATWTSWTAGPVTTSHTIALRPLATSVTTTVTNATGSLAGKTVTVRELELVPVTKATVTLTGKTITIRELELVPVAKASATFVGKTVVILSAGSDVVGVDHTAVTLVGKTVTVADTPTVIYVDKAIFALTGKSVGLLEKTAITKATVTFAGSTVAIATSSFEDVPKYIIRGRGSRHELWTQGYGGTIKGRGSRAFLVMR